VLGTAAVGGLLGGLLHLAMSAFAGVAFAVVLAVLVRAGLRMLATPAGYMTAATAGGALLYVVMMYGFAPLWNTQIVNFTPPSPVLPQPPAVRRGRERMGVLATRGSWRRHTRSGLPASAGRRPLTGVTGFTGAGPAPAGLERPASSAPRWYKSTADRQQPHRQRWRLIA